MHLVVGLEHSCGIILNFGLVIKEMSFKETV